MALVQRRRLKCCGGIACVVEVSDRIGLADAVEGIVVCPVRRLLQIGHGAGELRDVRTDGLDAAVAQAAAQVGVIDGAVHALEAWLN